MRDLGSIPSPHDAFLLNVGLESLHLRVARHCENAKKVAEYLSGNDKITWVNCPMLKTDKQYANLVRFSCGIEDSEDIIADIEQALAQI